MTDVHSPAIRRKNMQAIRAKNTTPEKRIRKLLYRLGYRFRLHHKKLPSKPDIVLAKYNAVILIHGCFWHGHDCHLFKVPKTRTDFWMQKITNNRLRDQRQVKALEELGYRVMIVWECAIKGRFKISEDTLELALAEWINENKKSSELSGTDTANSGDAKFSDR